MCARYIVPELGSPETSSTTFTPPPRAFESVAVPVVPEPLAASRGTCAESPTFLSTMACMFSISAFCDPIMELARWLTSGTSVRPRSAWAIGMVASWWAIMSLKNNTSALSGELAQSVDLIWGGHAWHEALGRVTHPRHGGLGAGNRQAPYPKPALHDADLALLGEGDVCAQEPHGAAIGPVAYDLGHLDGLAVVDDHIAGEAGLRRVIARTLGGEQQRQRYACHQDGHDGK
jgi:hypothetical protein